MAMAMAMAMAAAAAAAGSDASTGAGAGRWLPPHSPSGLVLQTVEMHTGGEPLRIIPHLEAAEEAAAVGGLSLLSLRRQVAATQDHVRRALMHEPRGHGGMYGAVVVRGAAAAAGAHLAALFLHGAGYSAMCGHAVMALGRFALDYGLVAAPSCPETAVHLRCPCGPVTAFVPWDGHRSGNPVRFHSVPAFAVTTGGNWACCTGAGGAGGLAEGHLANPSPVLTFLKGHQGQHKVLCTALWHGSTQVIVSMPPLHVTGFLYSACKPMAQYSFPSSELSFSLPRLGHRRPRLRKGGG